MGTKVDYSSLIPNNVGLSSDPRLQRALESWHPKFLEWWAQQGPAHYQNNEVYLRTATSVDRKGWAHFDYVKMPQYRWGVFLADNPPQQTLINFGEYKGQKAWHQVPGEFRGALRRLIVTQGDTEPASVEQQRILASTAPSLIDMRNLFQVNVEEARHLWAMVYLLMAHFGRDGREEAENLLKRKSGDPDKPRILGAFNERTPDWLSFFMFTYFTDRDGKYQLASLAESAFEPLARTCKFMLTEEAHHLYVGETGISRIIQKTCETMRQKKTDDPRFHGVIDLPTIQRYINFHFSVSEDLFGSEISTNAANYYSQGLKGRYQETQQHDDHKLSDEPYEILQVVNGKIEKIELPAITVINERLRNDYIEDCSRGVERWNKIIAKHGINFTLKLPHRAFNRDIGNFASIYVDPDGIILTEKEWQADHSKWLPQKDDHEFIASLMTQVVEPGQYAGWIAPPRMGVNSQPTDFPYVKFH